MISKQISMVNAAEILKKAVMLRFYGQKWVFSMKITGNIIDSDIFECHIVLEKHEQI